MSETLAVGVAHEWRALVAAAVLGTDRHRVPPGAEGWEVWDSDDPAVTVLERAGALALARRAGVCAAPAPTGWLPPAPVDTRPLCPPACAARLARLVGGEHEVLLAEWFALAATAGVQLPWPLLPALLLRGRRRPELDLVVRRLAGARAAWLVEAVPELGLAARPSPRTDVDELRPPSPPPDSRAAVRALLAQLHGGQAAWVAAPALQQLVASLEPDALAEFAALAQRLPFVAASEAIRSQLVHLADTRLAMQREFADPPPAGAVP